MSKPLVYLAGPITGCTYGGCTDWRQFVQNKLANSGIVGMSPMRHKNYLSKETTIEDEYAEKVLSCQRGIFARDTWDATRCDMLFANLLGADRVSIGTVLEIAWAWQARNPIVLIMERNGNIHDHSMIREACPFRVETIEEGIEVARALLLPGDH